MTKTKYPLLSCPVCHSEKLNITTLKITGRSFFCDGFLLTVGCERGHGHYFHARAGMKPRLIASFRDYK